MFQVIEPLLFIYDLLSLDRWKNQSWLAAFSGPYPHTTHFLDSTFESCIWIEIEFEDELCCGGWNSILFHQLANSAQPTREILSLQAKRDIYIYMQYTYCVCMYIYICSNNYNIYIIIIYSFSVRVHIHSHICMYFFVLVYTHSRSKVHNCSCQIEAEFLQCQPRSSL